jgi:hypothetical protein
LNRVIQLFVGWLRKWLAPGFQEERPRENFSSSVADGQPSLPRSEHVIHSSVELAHENPPEASPRETLISALVEEPKLAILEQEDRANRKKSLEENGVRESRPAPTEAEQTEPLSNEPVTVPRELSGSTEAEFKGQQSQTPTEPLAEETMPKPTANDAPKTDGADEDFKSPAVDANPLNECIRDLVESGVKGEKPTSSEQQSDTATERPVVAEALSGNPGEEILFPLAALSAMVGEKAASSELEWDESSERSESAPDKKPRVKSKKVTKDAGTPVQKTEDPTESTLVAGEFEKEPATPVDISPYTGAQLPLLPDSYLYWNRILLERFVTVAAGGQILLATSPRALAAALFDDKDERVLAADAQRQFAESVASAYKIGVVGSRARLRFFRRQAGVGGIPICVGFLALSVLAAHKMHTDETTWGSDYYTRLSELLGVERGSNGLPVDFRGDEFESLWLFLADWISKQTGWSLVLPQGNIHKRFIGYPLAHVPLRQLDIEKLPTFFEWAGYSSEMPPMAERMEDDLNRWNKAYGSLSTAGSNAFNDGRKTAVIAQVRSELRVWDGLVSNSEGTRSAHVEILLETVGRRSKLSLLAPRREGFPETFSSGPVQMTGSESWYDPVELKPEDGALIKEGFSWTSENQRECILRRSPGTVFVLAPNSEYSGMVSRMELPKGVTCAVLCHESVAPAVGTYLSTVCDSVPRPFRENTAPDGWFLFPRVRAIRRSENVPTELRALDVASEINIVPIGGLRAGTNWAWMQGDAPRLLIEGHDGQAVFVNDTTVDLNDEGFIKAIDIFAHAGIYRVRVGSLEKKVRIIQPSIRPSAMPEGAPRVANNKEQFSVILEVGHWVLVGSSPGKIHGVEAQGLRSTVIFCDFKPAWAIKLGARRPETRVIQLLNEPVVDAGKGKVFDSTRRWASAICAAAIRRPVVESAAGTEIVAADERWSEYVKAARAIKRAWKATHR